MKIRVNKREGAFIYFENLDTLYMDYGIKHRQILDKHNCYDISIQNGYMWRDLKKEYSEDTYCVGYIQGDIAIIDLQLTTCNLDRVVEKLEETGKFSKIEFSK